MTIHESLLQIKDFSTEVTNLKSMIRTYKTFIDRETDINKIRAFYVELIAICDTLDKYTNPL